MSERERRCMVWALQVSCSGRACWSLPAFHLLPRAEPTKAEMGGVHKPQSTPIPPTHEHACSLSTPPLTPIHLITVNWAVAFVDFRWNVPFLRDQVSLPSSQAAVDGEGHGYEPQNSMSSQNSPHVLASALTSYLLGRTGSCFGLPFQNLPFGLLVVLPH